MVCVQSLLMAFFRIYSTFCFILNEYLNIFLSYNFRIIIQRLLRKNSTEKRKLVMLDLSITNLPSDHGIYSQWQRSLYHVCWIKYNVCNNVPYSIVCSNASVFKCVVITLLNDWFLYFFFCLFDNERFKIFYDFKLLIFIMRTRYVQA